MKTLSTENLRLISGGTVQVAGYTFEPLGVSEYCSLALANYYNNQYLSTGFINVDHSHEPATGLVSGCYSDDPYIFDYYMQQVVPTNLIKG